LMNIISQDPTNKQLFICGGYVRDRLLGRECNDHDFVVIGVTPEEMLRAGFQQVGADFPVFLSDNGDEFALARTERKSGSGYSGFETDFGTDVTLSDDLARRDLTINSMARRVIGFNAHNHAILDDEVIDPFNGQIDLRDGIIRHTTVSFAEDPLRVLRAARFRARLGFDVAPDTLHLMQSLVHVGEMETLTTERVWVELEKAMSEDHPELFFQLLEECGALPILFPELNIVEFTHERVEALSVTERLMVLFAQSPVSLLERLKAPSNIQRLVHKLQIVISSKNDTPDASLTLLKNIDAFRNKSDVELIASVLGNDEVLQDCDLASQVTFASLSKTQQTTLTGKDIGEAMDKLRLSVLYWNK